MPEGESAADGSNTQGTTFVPCENAGNHADEPYIDAPLSRSEFDLPDGPLFRFHSYRKAWEKSLCRIREVVHTLYSPIVHAVLDSIQSAYADPGEQVVLPSPELVTLVVSSSDRTNLHEILLQILSGLCIVEDFEPQNGIESGWVPDAFISQLSGLECPNVTTAIKSIIAGFIEHPLRNRAAVKSKSTASLPAYDLTVLKAWYQIVKEEYGFDVPALIVLIHDLHAIEPDVLRDVLEICSLHVPHLPLIFVLGTSYPEHLHSVLPRSTLTCLRIDKHVFPWNVRSLEHVIRKTFFSPGFTPEIMLGPVGFQMIFKEFKRHNATLDAVLSTLQLLHIQHFYNPLSFLVDSDFDAVLLATQTNPPEDWMPFFKLLRQYCLPALFDGRQTPDSSGWSEIMPQTVIQTVINARDTFRTRTNQMKIALSVLETIWTFAKGHSKQTPTVDFEKIGLQALQGSLGDNAARDIASVMKQLSSNEVKALLEELYHLLHSLPSSARNHATELKSKVVVVKNDMTEENMVDFSSFLETYFTRTFVSLEDVACLDLWWTGDMNIPHSPLNPNPRVSIVTGLLEPREYLGLTALSTTESKVSSPLPDASLLFRRYVESGKMINVYDWYESFSVALESEASGRDGDHAMNADGSSSRSKSEGEAKTIPKRKKPEEEQEEELRVSRQREIQARFMRSMHELDFVGFLKYTGRKADHVLKTSFDVLAQ